MMPTERITRDNATGKAKVIHDMLDAVDDIKLRVKEDMARLIQRVPLDVILGQDGELEEYLAECVRVVMRRHVVTPTGVTPEVRRMVAAYVRGMA